MRGYGFSLRWDGSWFRIRDGVDNGHLNVAVNQLYAYSTIHGNITGNANYANVSGTCNGRADNCRYADSAGSISGDPNISVSHIYAGFTTVSQTNTDHLGIQQNTGSGSYNRDWIRVLHNSCTEFHRCYTDDILFNEDKPELFRKNYMGRIAIATGKIKTDITSINTSNINTSNIPPEWISKTDKDGIMIDDAIPIVQLSRIKKDKRVFGVFGSPTRSTNNPNRLIVNSIGEGSICVCNTNGNIENGDYIQCSDLLGYGEKQDDELLHNYTVAKSTIDCCFELDSPYYQCNEIANGIRVAFIACTYHCE